MARSDCTICSENKYFDYTYYSDIYERVGPDSAPVRIPCTVHHDSVIAIAL